MRKIINKKMYNTNTAVEIASCSNDASTSDFDYYEETLYKKKTGEFFLYGEEMQQANIADHAEPIIGVAVGQLSQ